MKQSTLNKVNKLVVGYLSITGLSNRKMREDNPINIYFVHSFIIKDKKKEGEKFVMTNRLFYAIVEECIKLYKKVDSLTLKQNPMIKRFIKDMLHKKDFDHKTYTSNVIKQFKETLYSLLKYYNSKNPAYNTLKLEFFQYKMWELAEYEQYLDAAEIRKKIKGIEEKIEKYTVDEEEKEEDTDNKEK